MVDTAADRMTDQILSHRAIGEPWMPDSDLQPKPVAETVRRPVPSAR